MHVWQVAASLSACAALAACGQRDGANTPEDAGDRRVSTQDGPQDACVTRYANSNEVADRGRLVQLDITLRYQASRAGRITPGDARMQLDAQSLLEGKASQLACAWDMETGGVQPTRRCRRCCTRSSPAR